MRRLLVPLVVTLALGAQAPAAFADNGPHAPSGILADSCATCHRAHAAPAPQLLVNTLPALCFTCHGGAGAGATTNVVDGVLAGSGGRGLRSGGFVSATMDTSWNGAVPATVTSRHTYDGTSGTAWANGAIGSGAGATSFRLRCTSCHDPHGGAGANRTATYRVLRSTPTDSGASTGVDVSDETTKVYTVANAGNRYFGEVYATAQRDPLSNWCAQCHTRDNAPSSSETTPSGDPIFAFRHLSQGAASCSVCHDIHGGPVPPNPYGTSTDIIHAPRCETCHVAHGTSAVMGSYAGAVAWPDGATSPGGNGRSSLLRLDSRGVCVRCHAK